MPNGPTAAAAPAVAMKRHNAAHEMSPFGIVVVIWVYFCHCMRFGKRRMKGKGIRIVRFDWLTNNYPTIFCAVTHCYCCFCLSEQITANEVSRMG